MAHSHGGRSSESLLDKGTILRELDIRPGQAVLDAGCGNGYMAKEFAHRVGDMGKVYALDPDKAAIETLRLETQGSNIEAIEGDVTKTTVLATASVDLIYLSTVFHGFSKDQIRGFGNEVGRLLKPRARLAVVEIDKRNTPFGPPLDTRFSPTELKQAIAMVPLKTVEVGQYFYMQLFGEEMSDVLNAIT
ncbi:MAG: class I SAM-dependent methyltransferase [Phycisphaerae bacterium]|nr:class I SAM-dependent methyltransferase [Phycisphaerae bacterium]